ncbi:MAG: dihydroorotate dehydrogenase-like protein [Bacteroidales bacterium]|nr:MAG: dihydroorotate dehydrogenase-like protein [Bacteroidales bacterium]
MADLSTSYMGIELKNPIIAGASNLVTDPDTAKRIEQAGASAIVYKSLFEEQIQLESLEMQQDLQEYNEIYAEMTTLFPDLQHAGPEEHLLNLKSMKDAVNIPVIASLNCVYDVTWAEYARELEKAGVDALELNFYAIPKDFETDERDIVENQIAILKKVKKNVSIPVSVKLSPFYTNPLKVIADLDKAGADAFVLFNKLFQPDLDIETEEMNFPYNLSNEEDNRLSLRFAGLLYGNINARICSNSGIFEGRDVIKMLLAGADCVQVVSTIYRNKPEHIAKMIKSIEDWMLEKKYDSIADFQGKLSKKNIRDPYAYKRAQYVDILMKANRIFERYPLK